jgi:hypothetical protein
MAMDDPGHTGRSGPPVRRAAVFAAAAALTWALEAAGRQIKCHACNYINGFICGVGRESDLQGQRPASSRRANGPASLSAGNYPPPQAPTKAHLSVHKPVDDLCKNATSLWAT